MRLFNGKEIKEGDNVCFIDSDKFRREFKVKKRKHNTEHAVTGKLLKKGTLFFCNASFEPKDYPGADLFKPA